LRLNETPDRDINTHRLLRQDGSWVWVEATFRLVRSPSGQPQEVVTVIRDITERRRLEERLRQTQRMEAVGQLTGGIAHDFNNLLTVVIGNLEMLVDRAANPLQQSMAQMALEASERGAILIQHLLAFSRRQTLEPVRLRLDEVLQGMQPLLERSISETVDLLIGTTDDGTLSAITDRALLESAILNLVVNARDAMPNGGRLTIQTGERIAGPDEGALPLGQPVVFVTVSDTGVGMSPEVRERAFEPYFTTKEVGKGSGLGLSMVYGFAQQSGGHVTIKSTEGVGTSVTIVIPGVEGLADGSARTTPRQPIQVGTGRVLLVEDEQPLLDFVTAQAKDLGYTVEAVADGHAALDLLNSKTRFDLLFTDVVLPKGISGIELAKQARAIDPDLKCSLPPATPRRCFSIRSA
jgi:signal transduction histidine kinase